MCVEPGPQIAVSVAVARSKNVEECPLLCSARCAAVTCDHWGLVTCCTAPTTLGGDEPLPADIEPPRAA